MSTGSVNRVRVNVASALLLSLSLAVALITGSGCSGLATSGTPGSGGKPQPTPSISNVSASGVSATAATITWTSNVATTSQVEYGTTTSYGQSTALDSTLVTSHSVGLTGLTASTTYHFRVHSRDVNNQEAVSGDMMFTTTATADTTPPTLSAITANGITASGATITWSTNEASTSQVDYGTTISYGQSSALDSSLVTNHSVGLSGLSAGTLYHYRVRSRDAAGNLATSSDFTFTTSAPSSNPPVISNVAASNITASGATITWTTDQAADSQVDYGTTTSYGQSTPVDSTLVTNHSVTLSGLSASTTYHYRVRSRNVGGQSSVSSDGTFTTAAAPPPPPQGSGAPVLYFSDLVSGPSTGNSDNSQAGQVAGQDGAIVSVWGQNLGTSQGTSTISVNGASARVYYWGNAVPPFSPANLYNGIQRLQLVIFQVSHLATGGAGQITVQVNGKTSNAIPFTVRSGRIFFVSTAGSDSTGSGSWTAPWRTMAHARMQMTQAGDITYVLNGADQTTEDLNTGVALRLDSSGTSSQPKAFVAYPGATVNIGTSLLEALQFFTPPASHSFWWTFSKFRITGTQNPIDAHTGERFVGCYIHDVPGTLDTGTFHVDGDDVYVLGNEFFNNGSTTSPSELYHTLYVSGLRDVSPQVDETNREIAWNYFHDNSATRAINIYSEPSGAGSDLIKNHRVHHNVITNQWGDGIGLLFWVSGENWVYDNVLINVGLNPTLNTQFACIDLRAGSNDTSQKPNNIMHVFNNTCYKAGSGTGSDSGALVVVRTAYWTPDVHNNIFYQANSQPYISRGSDAISANAAQWSDNLWFGAGVAPSWDSNSVNADPQFVNAAAFDLHLLSTSPAIDRGVAPGSSFVTIDFDGTPRPQGPAYDIGAYEFF